MRRLLALVALTTPLACSGMSPEPTTPPSTDCTVLRLRPPPKLHVEPCNETMDCLPWHEAVALAKWIADVEETRIGLEGCPWVRPVDE
jgi:hypothetical protein